MRRNLYICVFEALLFCSIGALASHCNKSKVTTSRGDESEAVEDDVGFKIAVPETANEDEKVRISWSSVDGALVYHVVVAVDTKCSDTILTFNDVTSTAQTVTFSSAGSFYLCVNAELENGEIVAAANSGLKIMILGPESGGSKSSKKKAAVVSTPALTSFTFSIQPTAQMIGLSLADIEVTAYDQHSDVFSSFTGDVTLDFGTNSGGGTLSGTVTVAAVSGVTTFSGIAVSAWGFSHTLKATSSSAQGVSEPFTVYDSFAGGDGSGGAPYQISSVSQLQSMKLYPTLSYVITQNIDASASASWNAGAGFVPVGDCGVSESCGTADNTNFTGSLDGGSFKISDLNINWPSRNGVGIFAAVNGATISRLMLLNPSVTGNNHTASIAALVENSSTINILVVKGGTVTGNDNTGGLVGDISGSSTISRSITQTTVSGNNYTGGLVGYVRTGVVVSTSQALGDVDGASFSGGFAGIVVGAGSKIETSFAAGFLTSKVSNGVQGGFVGSISSTSAIDLCYTAGGVNISNGSAVGAFAGSNAGALSQSYASGYALVPVTNGAGFVGVNETGATIDRSFSSAAAITSTGFAPGLVAVNSGAVTNSFFHNHQANGNGCIGTTTTAGCLAKHNGYNPNLAPVSFAEEFLDGRKIGASDLTAFEVRGQCLVNTGTINIKLVDDSLNTVSVAATCTSFRFSTTLDATTLDNGTDNITVTIENADSCTPSTDCYTATRTISKDALTCAAVTTNGDGFQDDGGDGNTVGTPHVICNASHMDNVRNFLGSGKYFKLGSNIDLSSGFVGPIGTSGADFNGVFDGNDFRIDQLNIFAPDDNYIGLFGYVSNGSATIDNLGLENSLVMGFDNVGLLTGYTRDVAFSSSYVSGSVWGNENVGGLSGYLQDSTVANTQTYGHLHASGQSAGGVTGRSYGSAGDFTNVESRMNLIALGTRSGGLIGYVTQTFESHSSFSKSHIIATSSDVGGFAGSIGGGSYDMSYTLGNIISSGAEAGAFGGDCRGAFTNSYAYGNVIANSSSGGFCGFNTSSGSFDTIWAAGDVWSGGSNVGGLIGSATKNISNSWAVGNIYAPAGQTVGGLIGNYGFGVADRTYAVGNVMSGTGTGGHTGVISGNSVTNSFSTGNIKSTGVRVGGFIGRSMGSVVMSRIFATGHVDGVGDSGGLIGVHEGSADLSYGFATGKMMTSAATIGGLIGENDSSVAANYLFYYNDGGANESSNCIGDDAQGNLTCTESDNPHQKSMAAIDYQKYYTAGRKVGASDQNSFLLKGVCNDWDAVVYVSAIDTAGTPNTTSATAFCNVGHWDMTLDLQGMEDGTQNITVTAELQDGGCTPSSTCETKLLVLSKETAVCQENYQSLSTPTGFADGIGTVGDPFLICDAKQLDLIRTQLTVNTYFELHNNINLYDFDWVPIGTSGADFNGRFDGKGFIVRNYTVNLPTTDYLGLFGYVNDAANAVLMNLQAEGFYLNGDDSVSGIVGYGYLDFYDSITAQGYLVGDTNVSGIAGDSAWTSDYSNLHSYTHVIGTDYAAGLIGRQYAGTTIDSSSHGHILGTGYTGNFIGGGMTIKSSFATGNTIVDGFWNASAFVAKNDTLVVEISDSYSTGNLISTNSNIGLITGAYGNIFRCYATGSSLSTGADVGGLGGKEVAGGGNITDSFFTGIVDGSSATNVGAIAGSGANTVITNTHFYDHADNPAICEGTSTVACTSAGDATGFQNNAASPANDPVFSWDYGTPIWKFDTDISLFPVLDWQ